MNPPKNTVVVPRLHPENWMENRQPGYRPSPVFRKYWSEEHKKLCEKEYGSGT